MTSASHPTAWPVEEAGVATSPTCPGVAVGRWFRTKPIFPAARQWPAELSRRRHFHAAAVPEAPMPTSPGMHLAPSSRVEPPSRHQNPADRGLRSPPRSQPPGHSHHGGRDQNSAGSSPGSISLSRGTVLASDSCRRASLEESFPGPPLATSTRGEVHWATGPPVCCRIANSNTVSPGGIDGRGCPHLTASAGWAHPIPPSRSRVFWYLELAESGPRRPGRRGSTKTARRFRSASSPASQAPGGSGLFFDQSKFPNDHHDEPPPGDTDRDLLAPRASSRARADGRRGRGALSMARLFSSARCQLKLTAKALLFLEVPPRKSCRGHRPPSSRARFLRGADGLTSAVLFSPRRFRPAGRRSPRSPASP